MSNTILLGFHSQRHQGEEDSLLLKHFLAGGDSGKRERREHSNSLFPAHISAAIDTNEWLAENKNKASSVALAFSGKENIMAPVLKSTTAEYWLDRQNRPPVNERVPDPAISLWLAAPRPVTTDGGKTNSAETTGESSPKRPRICWPKNITEYRPDNWLASTGGSVIISNSPEREWLAAKSPITKAMESLSMDDSWAMSDRPNSHWLVLTRGSGDEGENSGSGVSEVDTWLAKNVANFNLSEDTEFPIGDGESSIEVLEDGDYDLIDRNEGVEDDDDDDDEEEDSVQLDLSKWLVVN